MIHCMQFCIIVYIRCSLCALDIVWKPRYPLLTKFGRDPIAPVSRRWAELKANSKHVLRRPVPVTSGSLAVWDYSITEEYLQPLLNSI